LKTERIDLAEGAWWEFKTVKTVGMAIAGEKACLPYMKAKNVADVVGGKTKELKYEMDLDSIDFSAVSRELVFAGTVAWSYGPVTRDVFENEVPQADYEVVAGRCDELFGSGPLVLKDRSV